MLPRFKIVSRFTDNPICGSFAVTAVQDGRSAVSLVCDQGQHRFDALVCACTRSRDFVLGCKATCLLVSVLCLGQGRAHVHTCSILHVCRLLCAHKGH